MTFGPTNTGPHGNTDSPSGGFAHPQARIEKGLNYDVLQELRCSRKVKLFRPSNALKPPSSLHDAIRGFLLLPTFQ